VSDRDVLTLKRWMFRERVALNVLEQRYLEETTAPNDYEKKIIYGDDV